MTAFYGHKYINHVLVFVLRSFGGKSFSNRAFSPFVLLKCLFRQKVLRINGRVPWPVDPSSKIRFARNIVPGNRCPGLSPGCYIQGQNGIIFGNNVWVGPGVGIISADHKLDNFTEHVEAKPIRIGDNCWIGMNAVILPEVELGDHVIVGAGAVVTRSFGPNCVIAGNPARVIKTIGSYKGT